MKIHVHLGPQFTVQDILVDALQIHDLAQFSHRGLAVGIVPVLKEAPFGPPVILWELFAETPVQEFYKINITYILLGILVQAQLTVPDRIYSMCLLEFLFPPSYFFFCGESADECFIRDVLPSAGYFDVVRHLGFFVGG